MAYAPSSVYIGCGDGSIIGRFLSQGTKNVFEYSKAYTQPFGEEYPHLVWFTNEEVRFAKVMKTVAYIVIDEAADGSPVVMKMPIKNHKIY